MSRASGRRSRKSVGRSGGSSISKQLAESKQEPPTPQQDSAPSEPGVAQVDGLMDSVGGGAFASSGVTLAAPRPQQTVEEAEAQLQQALKVQEAEAKLQKALDLQSRRVIEKEESMVNVTGVPSGKAAGLLGLLSPREIELLLVEDSGEEIVVGEKKRGRWNKRARVLEEKIKSRPSLEEVKQKGFWPGRKQSKKASSASPAPPAPAAAAAVVADTPMTLLEYSARDALLVPRLVTECCAYLEHTGFDAQGIFRLSGGAAEIQQLKQQFREGAFTSFEDASSGEFVDMHAVSGLLKLFFRELKEPLFTFDLHYKFTDAAQREDVDTLKELLSYLPAENMACLNILCPLLLKVCAHEKLNMMSVHNIGIVFGPTLMKSIEERDGAFDFSNHAADCVEFLLNHWDECLGESADTPAVAGVALKGSKKSPRPTVGRKKGRAKKGGRKKKRIPVGKPAASDAVEVPPLEKRLSEIDMLHPPKLQELLDSHYDLFLSFAVSISADASVACWASVGAFTKSKDVADLTSLFQTHLLGESEKMVNISPDLRSKLAAKYGSGETLEATCNDDGLEYLLSLVNTEILHMLKSDIYPKFLAEARASSSGGGWMSVFANDGEESTEDGSSMSEVEGAPPKQHKKKGRSPQKVRKTPRVSEEPPVHPTRPAPALEEDCPPLLDSTPSITLNGAAQKPKKKKGRAARVKRGSADAPSPFIARKKNDPSTPSVARKKPASESPSADAISAALRSMASPREPLLQEFLEQAGLEKFLPLFEERQMSYSSIKFSEEGDLVEAGIPASVERKVLAAILEVTSGSVSPSVKTKKKKVPKKSVGGAEIRTTPAKPSRAVPALQAEGVQVTTSKKRSKKKGTIKRAKSPRPAPQQK